MLQIPVSQNGNSDTNITLEGITYIFQYRFNSRNKRFFLNILQEDGTELIMGMRLLEFSTPNFNYPNVDAPQGLLFVSPLNQDVEDFATIGNFGISLDYSLIYFTSDEVTST
ncbi:MAG: hypothetical protein GY804_11830 [Alphaproteobacteria bacterium]|nr:hypothetical protein [Alphaproteobacteria bacterium]